MQSRVYLTFDQQHVREPLIWKLAQEFDVVTNIRMAEVKDGLGLVGLEIDGEDDVVSAAIRWLEAQGVQVAPIEQDLIEG